MQQEVNSLDDGRIEVYRYSGALKNEDIVALMSDRSEVLLKTEVKLFIVDVSNAEFDEISPDHIRQFAMQAAETRKQQSDFRPTLIVAPSALLRGLSNMMSGFRGDDIQIAFASFDEALAWARHYIEEQAS